MVQRAAHTRHDPDQARIFIEVLLDAGQGSRDGDRLRFRLRKGVIIMDVLLDMRDREPPEPLFETLDCIDGLQPGDVVRLRIHREPLMIYPHLTAMNIPWEIERFGSPDWLLRIGPMPEGHGR